MNTETKINTKDNSITEQNEAKIEVKYNQICDKYGFCILQIIPVNALPIIEAKSVEITIKNEPKEEVEIQNTNVNQNESNGVKSILKKTRSFKGRVKK
jgi:hypothetical protein